MILYSSEIFVTLPFGWNEFTVRPIICLALKKHTLKISKQTPYHKPSLYHHNLPPTLPISTPTQPNYWSLPTGVNRVNRIVKFYGLCFFNSPKSSVFFLRFVRHICRWLMLYIYSLKLYTIQSNQSSFFLGNASNSRISIIKWISFLAFLLWAMQETVYSLFPQHGGYFRANDCSIEILVVSIKWIIFC